MNNDYRKTEEYKKKMSIAMKKARTGISNGPFSNEARKNMSEAHIGKGTGNSNSNWRGGSYISLGYRFILKRDYPGSNGRGYIKEHRYVMSEHLGRELDRSEDVHHINGDKLDNRIENLEILSHGEHARKSRNGVFPARK